MIILNMVFPNDKALQTFIEWLDNSGEQEYWMCAEMKDPENKNTVTFEYNRNLRMINCPLMEEEK